METQSETARAVKPQSLVLTEDHRYILDGREIPGVTSVIRRFCPAFAAGQWYLERGSAVHRGIELALLGQLDAESVDPRIKGRIEAAMLFLAENNLKPVMIEARLASRNYRFAGTLDCIAERLDGTRVLIDWKASHDKATIVQLGGYLVLATEHKISRIRATVCVETRDDGKYKAHWHLSRRETTGAESVFLNMLSCYNWQEANNVRQPE